MALSTVDKFMGGYNPSYSDEDFLVYALEQLTPTMEVFSRTYGIRGHVILSPDDLLSEMRIKVMDLVARSRYQLPIESWVKFAIVSLKHQVISLWRLESHRNHIALDTLENYVYRDSTATTEFVDWGLLYACIERIQPKAGELLMLLLSADEDAQLNVLLQEYIDERGIVNHIPQEVLIKRMGCSRTQYYWYESLIRDVYGLYSVPHKTLYPDMFEGITFITYRNTSIKTVEAFFREHYPDTTLHSNRLQYLLHQQLEPLHTTSNEDNKTYSVPKKTYNPETFTNVKSKVNNMSDIMFHMEQLIQSLNVNDQLVVTRTTDGLHIEVMPVVNEPVKLTEEEWLNEIETPEYRKYKTETQGMNLQEFLQWVKLNYHVANLVYTQASSPSATLTQAKRAFCKKFGIERYKLEYRTKQARTEARIKKG